MIFSELFESEQVLDLLAQSLKDLLKSQSESGLFGSISPKTFNMKNVSSSSPVIEYVVRPHVNILTVISAYLYHDHFPENVSEILSKDDAIKSVIKGIEWLCNTHITGNEDIEQFLSRKRWGENWRSGLWAALTGLCAFLVQKHIPNELLKQVQKVVIFEANRFIGAQPPDGCEYYSRAEENAQDTAILAWAINALPDHDNIDKWKKTLNIWALNIATSIEDHTDHRRYMDKSFSYWINTTTLYPDLTAESHGFFNPETLGYSMWIVFSMAAYKMHNNKIPDIFYRKNHQKTFDTLLRFCQPNGMLYSPAGSDLPLLIPHPFLLAWGLWNNDPRALKITSTLLNWMQDKLKDSWVKGLSESNDGWSLYFRSQPALELALLAILPFPKEQKFYTMGQIENAVDTRQIYPYVEVAYRRNVRTTRSVAWKALGNHPLISLNIHSYPELIAPLTANMLGIPVSKPGIKSWEIAHHEEKLRKHGFDTFGKINYFGENNHHIMTREIRVLAWGEDGLLVFDRIKAETQISIHDQYLSPIYLVNDIWTDNKLKLMSGSLKEQIDSSTSKDRAIHCPAFWISIEDRFLFQFIWNNSKGLTYLPGKEKNAPAFWKNGRLDSIGTHVEKGEFGPNDIIYETGFFVGSGKSPKPFKSAGYGKEFFKGIVIMDGKETVGLD